MFKATPSPPSQRFLALLAAALLAVALLPASGARAQTLAAQPVRIEKIVVNTLGGLTPSSFNVTLTCTPDSTASGSVAINVNVAVSANGVATYTPYLQSVCTVTEPPPPPVAQAPGCGGGSASWTRSIVPYRFNYHTNQLIGPQSNPNLLIIDGLYPPYFKVTNTLTCETGDLLVKKKVVNTLGVTAPATFAMSATCGPTSTSFSVSPAGLGATVSVPANVACSVFETLPPPIGHVPGCNGGSASWTSINAPMLPVTVAARKTRIVWVTNTLTCDPPAAGGRLTLKKVVVNTLGATVPATFGMTARCGVLNLQVSLAGGQGVSLAPLLAVNTACTVTEQTLAPIGRVPGCNGGSASWTTTYSPAQTVTITANATTTLTITNSLKCDPVAASGRLTVEKVVVNTLGATIPSAFNMNVRCTPGPLNTPVALAAGQGVSLAALIPANSNCKVTEAGLAPIANVRACNGGLASWTTTYAPAQTVPILAGATTTVTVTNRLTCDGALGDLRR